MPLLGYSDSTAFQLGAGPAREGPEKESKNNLRYKYKSYIKRLKHMEGIMKNEDKPFFFRFCLCQ